MSTEQWLDGLITEQPKITTQAVAKALHGYLCLRNFGSIILKNVYVDKSPWESDAICVTKAYFWTEYEIKVSIEDYRADFAKKANPYSPTSPRKHDLYKSEQPIQLRSPYSNVFQLSPKPKHFYFVVPVGLLDKVEVPPHCGIAEFDPQERRSWGIKISRRAPTLKGHTKLDQSAIYNLAAKACARCP